MLSKPLAGWSIVSIGKHELGSASYLDDVPNIVLDEFIRSLHDMTVEKCPIHLQLTFDAEGYDFGCVVWNDELYVLNTASNTPPYVNMTLIETDDIKSFIINLAKEVYNNIHDDIDEWSRWNTDSDEENMVSVYKNQFTEKLSELNALITLNEILYKEDEKS